MKSRLGITTFGLLAACAILNTVKPALAAPVELLNWAPVPDTNDPEIVYTGAALTAGVGAQGNGDGNLPPAGQTPGGLQVDTVVTAPIPFSFPSSVFTGGTGYYDVTLTFFGLAPVGPAQQLNFGAFIEDAQALGPGAFTLTATPIAGPILLLSGNIDGATLITGINGGNSGATFNADGVTYTGGIIAGALPANAILAGNDLSISMTSVVPAFHIDPGTGQLAPFVANGTGSFDINFAPEPTSLAILALGAGFLARRRR